MPPRKLLQFLQYVKFFSNRYCATVVNIIMLLIKIHKFQWKCCISPPMQLVHVLYRTFFAHIMKNLQGEKVWLKRTLKLGYLQTWSVIFVLVDAG